MKQKSRKAKGRRLQNFVRDKILKNFPHLRAKDVQCVENYAPGTKRIRNRGNHFTSKNPDYKPQFQRTNEIRMLAKLKHRVDEETQEVLPEAIEIAKQQKRERLRKELETPIKKPYSSGIYNASFGSSYVNNMSPIAHKRNPLNFRSTNRGTTRFKKGPYEI